MIRFRCSQCGKKLMAGDEIIGRKVKCARCDKIEIVPESDNLARPVVSEKYAELARAEKAAKAAKLKKISPVADADNKGFKSSSDFSELFSNEMDTVSPNKTGQSGASDDESVPELFGHSAVSSSARPADGPQFTPQPRKLKRKVKLNPWVIWGGAAFCGIVVIGLIASFLIRQAYSEPKFRAEFEKMEEVQFYRRALVKMEQSCRRMTIISESIKLQGIGDQALTEKVNDLTESANGYTSNTRELLTNAAKMLLSGDEVKAKAMLVNTGRSMKTLTSSIEEAMADFPKQK